MKKKRFLLLLAASFAAISVAGCGSSSGSSSDTANPEEAQSAGAETDEPLTLKFFVRQSSYVEQDWNDMLQWQEMEKITGIHIDWELVDASAALEKRTLALASGDYPDVFWGADFTTDEFQKYVDQGIFIPLEDLIQEHAPNIQAVLDEDESIRKALTLPDGHIYSLPKISLNVNQRIWGKMWYSQPILDELGQKIPETVDEFMAYLRMVKEQKPELIPFACDNETADPFLRYVGMIGGAYGIFDRGITSPNFDYDEEEGKVRFIPVSEEYKEVLQLVNSMYTEGLIPQNLDNHTIDKLNIYGSQGQLASFMYNHTVPAGTYADDYVNAEAPLIGPEGKQLEVICSPKIQVIPSFMICSTNENPVETIQWLDYLYSEEGEKLFYMGIEGVSYTEDENGELHYVDSITNNPDGLTLDEAISLYSVWPASNVSCVRQVKYALDHPDGNSKFVAVGEKYAPYIPEELWNGFWYTSEENEEIQSIATDLDAYIIQARTEFITGKRSFDDWDNYLSDISKMRGDRYLELTQAAYERYAAN